MRRPIIPYNPRLKEFARQLRRKMTLAEVLLWKRVKGKQMCGYDFDRQRPVGRRVVDFYCKELKLGVDVDGSVHDSRRQQDEERQRELEALGIAVLRFWNYEVKTDMASVLARIEKWIRAEEQRRGWARRESTPKPNTNHAAKGESGQPTPNPSGGGEPASVASTQTIAASAPNRPKSSSPPGRGQGWVRPGIHRIQPQ